MQLKYEFIQILLPCEPFCKTGESYFEKSTGALVIPFAYKGERERCSCGEEYHIHGYRKIRLAAPSIGLHKKVYWEVKYCVYRCNDCDCYFTQQIPFRFGRTKCTTYLAKMICDDLDSNSRTIKDCAAFFCFRMGYSEEHPQGISRGSKTEEHQARSSRCLCGR